MDDAIGCVRTVAEEFGFDPLQVSLLVSATSELAMNALRHASDGELRAQATPNGRGLTIIVLDRGPGIRDPDSAIQDGYSTRDDGLGIGLGAVRRAVPQFSLTHRPGGGGTRAMITAYLPLPPERFAFWTSSSGHTGDRVKHATSFVHEVFGESVLFGVIGAQPSNASVDLAALALAAARRASSQDRAPAAIVPCMQAALRQQTTATALDICVGLLQPDRLQMCATDGASWSTSIGSSGAEHQPAPSCTELPAPSSRAMLVACTTAGIPVPGVLDTKSIADPEQMADQLASNRDDGGAGGKVLVVRREAKT